MDLKTLIVKSNTWNLARIFKLGAMSLVLLVTMVSFAAPANADLQGMKTSLETAGEPLKPSGGTSGNYIPTIVANLLNAVLSMIGVLLLGYLIYAGFLWMTAGGDEGKVKKAIDMIRNAIVGLLIIVLSFVIADFVLGTLIGGLSGATGGSE